MDRLITELRLNDADSPDPTALKAEKTGKLRKPRPGWPCSKGEHDQWYIIHLVEKYTETCTLYHQTLIN